MYCFITIFLTVCRRKTNDYNLLGIGNNIHIVLLLSSSLYAGRNQMTTTYLVLVIIYILFITIFLTVCRRKPNDYNLLGIGDNIHIVLLLSSSLYAGGKQMTTTYLVLVIIYVLFYYYLPHCMQAENK